MVAWGGEGGGEVGALRREKIQKRMGKLWEMIDLLIS
jgi:hypothetical protein